MGIRDAHTVTLHNSPPICTIPALEMEPGQFGQIVDFDTGNAGRIVTRVWESEYADSRSKQRFVALDNPSSTWTSPAFRVRLLEEGEQINIVVGKIDIR